MEETMMMMAPSIEYSIHLPHPTTPPPTWKLYHNPFYTSLNTHEHHWREWPDQPTDHISSDLEFFATMNELDRAKALVEDLRAEVELERTMRKKAEAASKKLAREVGEVKEEMERLKKEVEEERRMLRMAEVWREERVQMKMADARLLMEEKLAELAQSKLLQDQDQHHLHNLMTFPLPSQPAASLPALPSNPISSPSLSSTCNLVVKQGNGACSQRKGSPESENPHIVRGIKGYVEFPRVIRAVSSRGRTTGSSKVECQKAQLKLLLRHRSPVAAVAGANNNSVTVG